MSPPDEAPPAHPPGEAPRPPVDAPPSRPPGEAPRPPGTLGLNPDAAIRARLGAVRAAEADGQDGSGRSDPGAGVENPAGAPGLAPLIDTSRYQRIIGLVGLVLVIAFSVYLFARGGNGTPGVAPGQRLHRFVAPLASSGINATVNAHPVCNLARPARHGLNVCGRRATVLAFFALDAKPCVRQVDTLQTVAARFPRVQFAAVAVGAGQAATAALVRAHHWTIPVAYDQTGVTSQLYGIAVCPLVELARPGGVVARRLIGEHWLSPASLAGVVATLER